MILYKVFWEDIIKVQIPPKEKIWYLLPKDESLLSRNMNKVPIDYIDSVYHELKFNKYDFY